MRLVVVHASSELYGSDIACLRVAARAVEAGWEVTAVVPPAGPLLPKLESAGVRIAAGDPLTIRRADLRPLHAPATPFRWTAAARRLARLAASLPRPDAVYTSTAPTMGGALLARRWRVPHVWHVHELFWQPRPIVDVFERVLSSAEAVVCCSGAVRDQFRPRVRDRARVAYSGADVPAGIPESRPLDRPTPRVVCVGRINEWKGQEVLVAAVGLLRDRGIEVELALVGDVYANEHQYRHRLEDEIARLGLGRSVTLLGERRDALALVGDADVFVLPSRRPEPFGMALVEAMALARPVVATAGGGPSEIVTDGVDGLLVPRGDPDAMATAMAALVRAPERARAMGDRARVRAAQLTTSAMAGEVVELLGEIATGRGPVSR
jgi:glycosyltransferase involved in cell wall biosynthesis